MYLFCALATDLGIWGIARLNGVSAVHLNFLLAMLLPTLYLLYKMTLGNRARRLTLFSVLFSLCTAAGLLLDVPLCFADGAVKMCILILLLGASLFPLTLALGNLAMGALARASIAKNTKPCKARPLFRFFAVMGLFLLAWLPVWLAYFPGFLNYDPYQIKQVEQASYRTDHPLLHTLLLGNCFRLGWLFTGEGNLGVAIYDAIQASILAAAFSYSYLFLCKRTDSRLLRGPTLAFYALFPPHAILAISTTKDVIFSALVLITLLLFIEFIEALRRDEQGKTLRLREIALLVSSTLTMMFRNNAISGFIGLALLFLLLCRNRSRRKFCKRMLALTLCAIVCFGLCSFGLKTALHAGSSATTELLSIPVVQYGRVCASDAHDSDAKAEMARFFDAETMYYQPNLADRMKWAMSIPKNASGLDFIKAWLGLVWEYPAECIDAFLYLNKGMWDVGDTSFSEVYGKGKRLGGYLQTIYNNSYKVNHKSHFPQLEALYEKLFTDNRYQNIPLLSILFSPALYFWLSIFAIIVLCRNKKQLWAAVVGFFPFYSITILLGPCTLVRYMYSFMTAAPAILALLVASFRQEETPDMI